MSDLEKHQAEVERVLTEEDMQAFRRMYRATAGEPSRPIVFEMAFHKARVAVLRVPYEKRMASALWLKERGLTSYEGTDPVLAVEESQP